MNVPLSLVAAATLLAASPQPATKPGPAKDAPASTPPAAAKPAARPSGFAYENTPANLKAFFTKVHELQFAKDEKSTATLLAMTRELVPDFDRARKALRPDLSKEAEARVKKFYDGLNAAMAIDDKILAGVFKHAETQTEVLVTSATSDELAADVGKETRSDFPGGARIVAQSLLKPGLTVHQVRFVEPGKTTGTAFHLFTWDGARWCMLGPLWRAEPKSDTPPTPAPPSKPPEGK